MINKILDKNSNNNIIKILNSLDKDLNKELRKINNRKSNKILKK